MSSPLVYITIANWNGRDMLRDCLSSLIETTDYENYEIVVIDNGSEDSSVEMLMSEFPGVNRIKNEENKGFAKAQNQGFDLAMERGADYVLMLNNDIEIVDPEWLKRMVEHAERHESVGIMGCRVLQPDGTVHYDGRNFPLSEMLFPRLHQRFDYNRFQRKSDHADIEFVDQVVGAVFLIDRAVIEKVGKLDEAYSPIYHEESDYCVRAWDAGFAIAYTSEVTVVHFRKESSSELNSSFKDYAAHRNKARFMLLNYPLSWLLVGIPMHLLLTAKFFLDRDEHGSFSLNPAFVSAPFTTLSYAIRAHTDLLCDLPKIVRLRQSRRNIKALTK